MRRILVFLLCMLAVFAVVSCKNDPTPTPEPTPTPTPTPDPPEPSWETGTLVVRPAEGCSFSQEKKFQFQMALQYNANEPIELKMYCSEDVTAITVRQAGDGDQRFIPDTSVYEFETDEDGWYIIKLTADQVIPTISPCFAMGITVRLPDDNRMNCYVAIKDMKINGEAVDFLDYEDDDSFVSAYVTSPDALDFTIVE